MNFPKAPLMYQCGPDRSYETNKYLLTDVPTGAAYLEQGNHFTTKIKRV